MPGCSKGAQRNPATKKAEFCKAHGGGPRCSQTDALASEEVPPSAPHKLPTGDRVCLQCRRQLKTLREDDGCLTSPELYVLCEIKRRLPGLACQAVDVLSDLTFVARSLHPPAMLWDLGPMVLWLEVNEHQHATCDPRHAWDRCNQIWEHFGCRPALVIEFNPDSYESAVGDVVDGMFREKRTNTDDRRLSPTAEADRRMSALAAALEEGAALATSSAGPTWKGVKQRFMYYTPATEALFTFD